MAVFAALMAALVVAGLAPRARGDTASGEKLHGTPKTHSLILAVNAANATIMEDDLLVGHGGDRLDSAPGPHAYVISAPGYVPRMIRTFQNEAQRTATRTVVLLPVLDKTSSIELDFAQAKAPLAPRGIDELLSYCATFNNSGEQLPARLSMPCHRQTVLEDLATFSPVGIFDPAIYAHSDPAVTELLKHWDHANDDSFYWTAEDVFSSHPSDMVAANLLAFSALRHKNCARVNEITMEESASRFNNPGLLQVRALCLELNGKSEKALALYQAALKGKPPGSPDLLYEIARVSYPNAATAAAATMQTCTKQFPNIYHCAETLAQMLMLANQSAQATQALQAYHQAATLAIQALLKSGKLSPAAINAAYELRPFNFELALAAVAGAGRDERVLASAALISDPRALKTLLPVAEKHLTPSATLTAYRILSSFYPKDGNIWVKIGTAFTAQGNCVEAVAATDRALSLISDPDRLASITVNRADCLVRIGRVADAKTQLRAVIASGHETWQAHYNLGIVDERQGATKDALEEYRLALQGEMPANVRAQVQQRLDFAVAQGSKHANP